MKRSRALQRSVVIAAFLSMKVSWAEEIGPSNATSTKVVEEAMPAQAEGPSPAADGTEATPEAEPAKDTTPEEAMPSSASQPSTPEVPAPAPADELNEPLSPELKLMREIEPGFIPKDDRAVQLFMLQKIVNDNDTAIKFQKEEKTRIRTLFSAKFREQLALYSREKLGDKNEQWERAVQDSIKAYEHALHYNPRHPLGADALYFLGLSYFEVDEKIYFEKLAAYSAAREQGRDDVDYPEENFNRTIDAYERLIKLEPNHRHMDSVYYLLGLALWYEGDFYNAVERFQQLIAEFPNSKFVEEIWFRLGEYFYDMDEYDDAHDAYARVLANPKSSLFDKAVYKTAWTYFQQDNYDKAIEYFIKIVELTESNKTVSMRQEALRYIVKSFAEKLYLKEERPRIKVPKKPAQAAGATQADIDKEYAEKIGLKLAKMIIKHFTAGAPPVFFREVLFETAAQLLDESKSDGAIVALQTIIKLDERHEDNPRIDSQIVDILTEAHRNEEARSFNLALIERYGKESAWYKAMKGNFTAQSLARNAVRDAMLSLAVYYHKEGKALKEAKAEGAEQNFKEAARLYSRYVKEYPEWDDTHKAIFYFAESAFELNRFRLALQAYQLLIDYPLPLPDNFRRDAIYNIVFTYRHVLEQEARKQRFKEVDFDTLTSKQRGQEQQEIPKVGASYLSAIDEFLKIAPKDEQVPVLLFHAAAIYYVYGHSEEALKRFIFIIESYPSTPAALVAARLVLDDAIAKEEWAKVIELSKQFQALDLGGQGKDFARIEGSARFKIARQVFEDANELKKNNQLSEAKVKYIEASELFAVLLREDPNNPYADIMLFNSARAIAQSGVMTAAIPLYKEVYTKYPNSEYAKSARFQEALALEKMLKFNEAAVAYDGIFKADPQSEAAQDAMLNKALLFEAAGNLPGAIDAFVAFAKKYPERDEAPDALLSAAGMYKKQGKTSQQVAMLEQFIRQYEKDPAKRAAVIEAHVQVADTYGDLLKSAKTPAESNRYVKAQTANYQAAVRLYAPELGSAIAAFYAAKAQLFLERAEQESFKKLSINARTGKAQADQLTAMMKKLTELAAKNENIIRIYAQAVSNAESLYRIGALYEHLARSMLKAPCPKDIEAIDDFACDEYLVLLEDKAAVLEEKALSAYIQAYDISIAAYDTPDELVMKIQTALNRLKPGKYQRVGNVIEKPSPSVFKGQGRMLSTGEMASKLHEAEVDPDVKKVAPVVNEPAPSEPETEKQGSESTAPEVPTENNETIEEEDFE